MIKYKDRSKRLIQLILTIVGCSLTILTFSQSLTEKYLHFKTDYYWDTILYKSEQDFYFLQDNGKIIKTQYPVQQYLFSTIVSEEPFIKKDSFEIQTFSSPPYKYKRKGNSIYIQYYDVEKRKLKLKKEYSLNLKDTVNWLVNKSTLDSKYGISVGGFSIFLGEMKIDLNGKQFEVYKFLEDHEEGGSHPSYSKTEIFIEKNSLIPIKFLTTLFDYKTRAPKSYSYLTSLISSSNSLQVYTNKKMNDLILFEDKTVIWTEKQRQEFLDRFSSDKRKYANCLLKKLDGQISYYHYDQNLYFLSLIVKNDCFE